jgi:hypothetical protein
VLVCCCHSAVLHSTLDAADTVWPCTARRDQDPLEPPEGQACRAKSRKYCHWPVLPLPPGADCVGPEVLGQLHLGPLHVCFWYVYVGSVSTQASQLLGERRCRSNSTRGPQAHNNSVAQSVWFVSIKLFWTGALPAASWVSANPSRACCQQYRSSSCYCFGFSRRCFQVQTCHLPDRRRTWFKLFPYCRYAFSEYVQ